MQSPPSASSWFSLVTSSQTSFASRVIRVALATFALSAASQVQVPLWMTPVPMTAQPQMVLLLAALLGPAEATAALGSWFAAALSGAPVFSQATNGAALFGPTAGFLLSYVLVVQLVGHFGREGSAASFFVWQAAGLVTLACGAAGLSAFFGMRAAFAFGVAPFWLADAAKIAAAFLLYVPMASRSRRRSA